MFVGSSGSISRPVCTSTPAPLTTLTTPQDTSRRPTPEERELIARTPVTTPAITSTIAHTMTCPHCGAFRKSGRVSCCAPGGAWFQNCGGAGNNNVDHRWFEGVDACKFITTTASFVCPKCGTIDKSGKISCCGRGGSWFKNCGSVGNAKLDYTWYEGAQACEARSRSKAGIDQQLGAARQKRLDSSNRAGVTNSSQAILTAAKPFTFTSVPMSIIDMPVSTSITVHRCEKLLDIVVHISLLIVITFTC